MMFKQDLLGKCFRVCQRHAALALVALLLGVAAMTSTPVLADDDDHRDGDREHRHGRHGHHDEGNRHREWREEDQVYGFRPNYPQPYYYAQPVYVPPPVYYAPRQSPGISLFFPLDLR